MKYSIGVVGQGFVGGSLSTVFTERGVDVYAFDILHKYSAGVKSTDSINDLVEKCENNAINFTGIYFICVPTPMYEDGGADLRIVESVLEELARVPGNRIAVVKSTVPPGSCNSWNNKFNKDGLSVIFNPEFLTEANALDDMRHQTRIVLGGAKPAVDKVKNLYRTIFPDVPILKTSKIATAEMVKYFTNLHLAIRVILSCELYQLCEALSSEGTEIDYERIVEFANFDKRLGGSHMNVPGNDGVLGARGHCFPKDMNALISLMKTLNVKPTVLEAAWDKNNEVVPVEHRDWEKMVGRAISFKKSI